MVSSPLLGAALFLSLLTPVGADAQYAPPAVFPPDSAYTPVVCNDPTAVPSQDPCADEARDHRNIIGGGATPAYLSTQDGTYLYLRLRVEDDPRQGGALVAFAWGFGIDANGNGAFEAYISLIGQGMADRLEILDQDPSNGTTPDLTQPAGGGTDTSLRPIRTDFSGPTWAEVTPAPGGNFCADDPDTGDWYITVALPLAALADFGALGGVVAYGGSSSEFSGIQNDFVCADGRPAACTTGTMCPSGVCLTEVGRCAPSVEPFFLGCVTDDPDGDGVDTGCSSATPFCVVDSISAYCVECRGSADCNDGNGCTSDLCEIGPRGSPNDCVYMPEMPGTSCFGGVCDATAPVCVDCIDDASGTTQDTGCGAAAPVCDTSSGTAVCTGCIADTDCDDGNECTVDACAAGSCVLTSDPEGDPCAGGVCNGSVGEPACVACVDDSATLDTGCSAGTPFCDTSGAAPVCAACLVDAHCEDGDPCTADDCAAGACTRSSEPAGTTCSLGVCDGNPTAPDCVTCIDDVAGSGIDLGCAVTSPFCDTSGASPICVACFAAADCNDGNACTAEACVSGTCTNDAETAGTLCAGGICDGDTSAPMCVACIDDVAGAGLDAGCGAGAPRCDTSGAAPICVACFADPDCSDGNDCTSDSCVAGVCTAAPLAAGTSCMGGVCDGAATPACLACIDDQAGSSTDTGCAGGAPLCDTSGAAPVCVACIGAADCDDSNACTADACTAGACSNTALSAGSACAGGVCDGAASDPACVVCVDDALGADRDTGCTAGAPVCDTSSAIPVCAGCIADTDCDDANECTADACVAGVCSATSLAAGSSCAGGVCDGAAVTPECVACVDDAINPAADSGCAGGTPFCDTSGAIAVCVGCTSASDCDDGNECTADSCTLGSCGSASSAAGTTCTGGVCDGAAASPECVPCIDDETGPTSDSGCSGASALCDTSRTENVCVPCVDDASGSTTDSGCGGAATLCDATATTPVCVPCFDTGAGIDDGCAEPDEVCVTSAGAAVCVSCEDTVSGPGMDFGCEASSPLCVTRDERPACIECVDSTTCPTGTACNVALGMCAPACTDDDDCAAPTPACDTAIGMCVECLAASHCRGRMLCGAGSACTFPDTDGDGIADDDDLDDDNDGIPDIAELGSGLSVDSDDDGVLDFDDPDFVTCTDGDADGACDEVPAALDFDGDGIPNHLDLDADGDGLTDLREGGGTDSNGDGRVDGFADADGNGLDDRLMASPLALPDTDGEGGPDFLDVDADGDGLTDTHEAGGLDRNGDGRLDTTADADGDGLADGVDPDNGGRALPGPDTDTDGTPDWRDLDSDADDVPDATEATDANHDGVPDLVPSGMDSDGDGLDDAFDPDAGGTRGDEPDTDGDGTVDWRDPDDDGDGVPTPDEDPDGDGDPTNDDTDGDGTPNYLDQDDDGDGIPTRDEDGDGNGDWTNDDGDADGVPDYLDPDQPRRGGFSGGALCSMSPRGTPSPGVVLVVALAALALRRRRSR